MISLVWLWERQFEGPRTQYNLSTGRENHLYPSPQINEILSPSSHSSNKIPYLIFTGTELKSVQCTWSLKRCHLTSELLELGYIPSTDPTRPCRNKAVVSCRLSFLQPLSQSSWPMCHMGSILDKAAKKVLLIFFINQSSSFLGCFCVFVPLLPCMLL